MNYYALIKIYNVVLAHKECYDLTERKKTAIFKGLISNSWERQGCLRPAEHLAVNAKSPLGAGWPPNNTTHFHNAQSYL